MKTEAPQHPKFRTLQRRLKMPQFAVVGLLESVWMMAAQFADDGDLTRFTRDEIEGFVGWEDDAVDLIEALVETRWLDRDGDRLLIHDWEDHCPHYVYERRKKRAQRQNKSQKRDDKPAPIPAVSPHSPGSVPDTPGTIPGLSDPTQPNPTQPNQLTAFENAAEVKPENRPKRQTNRKARKYAPEFETFWAAYWNPRNKAAAAKAFPDAVDRIVDDDALPPKVPDEAVRWLVNRTQAYSRQLDDAAEKLHAATYLNNDRFCDQLQSQTPSMPARQPRKRRKAS